jgi:hypothetical protein
MSGQRVERLRAWHEAALVGARRSEPVTVSVRGMEFVVPPTGVSAASVGTR